MDKKLIIAAAVILILFFILATLFLSALKKNTACLEDPFIYKANKIYEEGYNIYCSCRIEDLKKPGAEPYYFNFDRFGINTSPF